MFGKKLFLGILVALIAFGCTNMEEPNSSGTPLPDNLTNVSSEPTLVNLIGSVVYSNQSCTEIGCGFPNGQCVNGEELSCNSCSGKPYLVSEDNLIELRRVNGTDFSCSGREIIVCNETTRYDIGNCDFQSEKHYNITGFLVNDSDEPYFKVQGFEIVPDEDEPTLIRLLGTINYSINICTEMACEPSLSTDCSVGERFNCNSCEVTLYLDDGNNSIELRGLAGTSEISYTPLKCNAVETYICTYDGWKPVLDFSDCWRIKPGFEYEIWGVVRFDEDLQQNYLDVYRRMLTDSWFNYPGV